ncbi:MAG: HAD hydrolase family protein [Candidatus Hydrogenedentes bacterium]|nr:HAD hydrolase family protein [Candidatus Hydrogenedentota bacterium]
MTALEERIRNVQFIVCDVDGVLTNGSIFFDAEGRSFRAVHARDVTALTLWHLAGGKSALVSGLGSKAIEAIAATWRCTECHLWIKDKARICAEIALRHNIPPEAIAFLGDDIIDLCAMKHVGLAVAVQDAAPEVKAVAHFITDAPGGHGPLRELVHRILAAQGRLDETVKAYCDRKDGIQ